MVDATVLNLIASLLIVLVAARVLSEKWRVPLFFFGTYALPALGGAIGLITWFGRSAEPGAFYFGLAALIGLYWTAVARDEARPSRAVHVWSAVAAVGYAGIIAAVAVWYTWWIAPLVLLTLMGVGLVVNGLVPFVQSWRSRDEPDVVAPADARPSPSVESVAAPQVDLRHCPSCGLMAKVPLSAPSRVRCPRCLTVVDLAQGRPDPK